MTDTMSGINVPSHKFQNGTTWVWLHSGESGHISAKMIKNTAFKAAGMGPLRALIGAVPGAQVIESNGVTPCAEVAKLVDRQHGLTRSHFMTQKQVEAATDQMYEALEKAQKLKEYEELRRELTERSGWQRPDTGAASSYTGSTWPKGAWKS